MFNFQRVRSILFYLSVFLFFAGLPFIIASALGYKFNFNTFKFFKTGLIYIKTQPEGARIYLNSKLMPDKSPAAIYELIPGVYKVFLELQDHYSWKGEVDVEAGKASRLDKIILFSQQPEIAQLNKEKFSYFHVDTQADKIYYLDLEDKVVCRSDLNGTNFEDIASLPDRSMQIAGWNVSPDKKKLFIFNNRQVAIVFFDISNDRDYSDSPVFLDYPSEKLINVFWHSDSYHLIIVTSKRIQVLEARQGAGAVTLVNLNKEDEKSFYDIDRDVLYFSDARKNPDNSFTSSLYKLNLNIESFSLDKLFKKTDE